MKILDATAVIAFLSEMRCPEGIIELSKRTKIIVPEGVAREIVRSPGRETLLDLAKRGIIEITKVDQARVCRILEEYPQLHKGECEVVAFVQEHTGELHVVSDDSKARKIFQTLNFMWTEELLDAMRKAGTISEDIYKIKHHRGVVQIFVLQTHLVFFYTRFIGSDSVYLTEFPVIGARDHESRTRIAQRHIAHARRMTCILALFHHDNRL